MILYNKQEAGKRLAEIIKNSKLNSRQFALSIDGDPSYLSKMEKGDKGISKTYLEAMEQKYHINREWLLYGTGDAYLNGHNVPRGTYSDASVESLQLQEQAPSRDYIQKRRDQKNTVTPILVPLVPVKAQAGYVKSFDQVMFLETLERFALPPGVDHRGAAWRYFEIEGDSMEPTFQSGDVILASMVPQEDWQDVRNFYTYVILTDESLYIKRVYRKSSKNWVLISDNEKHYNQVLLPVEQVKELWVFRRHIDSKAPPPKKFEIKV